ncbi:hypothetical protein BOX15_Mlig033634g1, partial [Macrostomum lignano]
SPNLRKSRVECNSPCPVTMNFVANAFEQLLQLGPIEFTVQSDIIFDLPVVSVDKKIMDFLVENNQQLSLTRTESNNALELDAKQDLIHPEFEIDADNILIKQQKWIASFTGVVSSATQDLKNLHLWVQNSSDFDKLTSLQNLLDADADSCKALDKPKAGQFCIGLFEGSWYRAEVKAVSSDSIRVLFIDYGNEEEGSLDELQLKVLPQREELYRDAFAFECILKSSDNRCFSPDACDKIIEHGELQFSIDPSTDSEPPTVSIPKNILQSLTVTEVTDSAAFNANNTVVIELGKQQIESQANKSETWAVSKSIQSETFTGVVSNATLLDDGTKLHLWIQNTRDLDELASLQSQLDVEAASSEALTAPQIGQFCIGLFEGGWYRAEVKAVSSDSIRVLFIDYGNEEEGSLDELQLKVLPHREGLYRDALAFECILESSSKCRLTSNADALITAFDCLTVNIVQDFSSGLRTIGIDSDLLASLESRICSLEPISAAYDEPQKDAPVSSSTNDIREVRDASQHAIMEHDSRTKIWRVKRRQLTGTFTGTVCACVPTGDNKEYLRLWVHRTCDSVKLKALQDLFKIEADSAPDLKQPSLGQTCLVFHKDQWCRAEILATSSVTIELFLLDYGIEVKGSPSIFRLKPLPYKEELYCESFAFECILPCPGVNQIIGPVAQHSLCANNTAEESTEFGAITNDNVDKNCAHMKEEAYTTTLSISVPQCKWSVSKKHLFGLVSAMVVFAIQVQDDPRRLRLWIQSSRDLDELASLQSQLDIEAASSEAFTAPQIGQFCIGLFEGSWYRAEVKAVSSDSIRVLFIDYGNEEEGSLDELQLKVLPQREELYRDAFAFECILQSSDNCCFSTDACDKIVEYGELQFSIDPSTDSEPPTVSIPKDILQSLTVTEVTNSAASLASIKNNKLKPAVLPASTSIFFDGENNENFHKSWCKVPLTTISYESGSDRPENSEVLATVCCLQPITNCSKQSNTCSSEAEKRQHQQYRPRLRYTPDQLRAVFASMVHDYGCTIVPTPVPLPGRYSVIILPSSNSSQLMVHLLPQSLQQVDRLAKRMHFWYNKLGLLIKPVTKLYPGKSVAFFTMKSHGGGEWYRGRVLSIDTRNSQEVSATVLAVDYGFVSSGLLTSFIRELPPELTGPEWPAAICICRLASKDVLPQQPSLKRAGIEVLSDGTCCLLPPSKNADRNVEK